MIFVPESSPNHTSIKYRCLLKKCNQITFTYLNFISKVTNSLEFCLQHLSRRDEYLCEHFIVSITHFWLLSYIGRFLTQLPIAQSHPNCEICIRPTLGNHQKNLTWLQKFTNPNCTLCQNNEEDTWPNLLSLCSHKFLKGLIIVGHNAATQQLSQPT